MTEKKYGKGKEAECPDDTPPSKIEQRVGDRDDFTRMNKLMMKKRQNA